MWSALLMIALSTEAASPCEPSPECAMSIVSTAALEGPQQGIMAIAPLLTDPRYDAEKNTHEIAHFVGRIAAKTATDKTAAFLRCGNDYAYGCQHGFFEQMLGESHSPVEAAGAICEGVQSTDPFDSAQGRRDRFFCYHGVGHGVMMARAYDIDDALEECDRLGDDIAILGCHQGVFMENINAFARGEATIASCSSLSSRYQWGCYMNHAPYLLHRLQGDWDAAVKECMRTSATMQPVCFFAFGQLTTNTEWREKIVSIANDPLALCTRAPEEHQDSCIAGAVEQSLNHNRREEAVAICTSASGELRDACVAYINGDYSIAGDMIEIGKKTLTPNGGSFWSALRKFFASFFTFSRAPIHTYTVLRTEAGFEPVSLTVPKGSQVVWGNDSPDFMWPASDPHPIHQGLKGFDPGKPLITGEEWSFIFTKRGTWAYHDHWHSDVQGVVIVE